MLEFYVCSTIPSQLSLEDQPLSIIWCWFPLSLTNTVKSITFIKCLFCWPVYICDSSFRGNFSGEGGKWSTCVFVARLPSLFLPPLWVWNAWLLHVKQRPHTTTGLHAQPIWKGHISALNVGWQAPLCLASSSLSRNFHKIWAFLIEGKNKILP